jgi:hypothetical protein
MCHYIHQTVKEKPSTGSSVNSLVNLFGDSESEEVVKNSASTSKVKELGDTIFPAQQEAASVLEFRL